MARAEVVEVPAGRLDGWKKQSRAEKTGQQRQATAIMDIHGEHAGKTYYKRLMLATFQLW